MRWLRSLPEGTGKVSGLIENGSLVARIQTYPPLRTDIPTNGNCSRLMKLMAEIYEKEFAVRGTPVDRPQSRLGSGE
jgi:hypothetical protein